MKSFLARIPRAAQVLLALLALVAVESLLRPSPPEAGDDAVRAAARARLEGAWRTERERVVFGAELAVGERGEVPWSVVQAEGDWVLLAVQHDPPSHHTVCFVDDDTLDLACPLGVHAQRDQP